MYDELNTEINSVTMRIYELDIKLKFLNTLSLRQSIYLNKEKNDDLFNTITSLRKEIATLSVYKDGLQNRLNFISNIQKCRGM